MVNWLIEEILPNEQKFETLTEIVVGRWRELQIEPPTKLQVERINRINYEICVLKALRERLCCKEIWVVGACSLSQSR